MERAGDVSINLLSKTGPWINLYPGDTSSRRGFPNISVRPLPLNRNKAAHVVWDGTDEEDSYTSLFAYRPGHINANLKFGKFYNEFI